MPPRRSTSRGPARQVGDIGNLLPGVKGKDLSYTSRRVPHSPSDKVSHRSTIPRTVRGTGPGLKVRAQQNPDQVVRGQKMIEDRRRRPRLGGQ